MIRSEWEQTSNPHLMLGCLRGRASDRKLRLFGVACWRGMKGGVTDEVRHVLDLIEHYADGLMPAERFWDAFLLLPDVVGRRLAVPRELDVDDARRISRWAIAPEEPEPAVTTTWNYVPPLGDEHREESTAHGLLLNDLFGQPWRTVRFSESWRTPDVCELAWCAYAKRDPKTGRLDAMDLAVLGDALEEAGCSNAGLLAHCHSGGPHVRGCWAVDGILGRM